MKTIHLLTGLLVLFMMPAFAQRTNLNFTFTANNSGVYVRLDSIKSTNLTQGGASVIHWPDTTMTLDITTGNLLQFIGYATGYPVGVGEVRQVNNQFRLFQNYPNPVADLGMINLYLPERGTVETTVTDLRGREIISCRQELEKGSHSFSFTPGSSSFYFLTARWNGISRSIKILTTGNSGSKSCRLDYAGTSKGEKPLDGSPLKSGLVLQESAILDAPSDDTSYTFQFAVNIPCPGMPAITYEGQTYNTVQIFSQCWLKENLNVGAMISGSQNQTNNGILEKYCYDNLTSNCTQYGGLYQWNEMMQYTTQQGVQGICPAGWHVPTDEEWKVLEGSADSQYGIGNPVWNDYSYRGFDAGKNLKTTTGWSNNGNGADLYGFAGKPAGGRTIYATFDYLMGAGLFWQSTEYNATKSSLRTLHADYLNIYRSAQSKDIGYSVRCLKNN